MVIPEGISDQDGVVYQHQWQQSSSEMVGRLTGVKSYAHGGENSSIFSVTSQPRSSNLRERQIADEEAIREDIKRRLAMFPELSSSSRVADMSHRRPAVSDVRRTQRAYPGVRHPLVVTWTETEVSRTRRLNGGLERVVNTPPTDPVPRHVSSTYQQPVEGRASSSDIVDKPKYNLNSNSARSFERSITGPDVSLDAPRLSSTDLRRSTTHRFRTETPESDRRNQGLPDILHSHLPPTYGDRTGLCRHVPRHPVAQTPRRSSKQCCWVPAIPSIGIRGLVAALAGLGLGSATIGAVLGVLQITGSDLLTVSLLMIGVGIVLIMASGIAWRLTSRDSVEAGRTSGQRGTTQGGNRPYVPHYPRYQHPFTALLYPDIPLRPPPPSYQASMQDYRLRHMLVERLNGSNPPLAPPAYRSLRLPLSVVDQDYSRPPSYTSRAGSLEILNQPHIGSENRSVTIGNRDTHNSFRIKGANKSIRLATSLVNPHTSIRHESNISRLQLPTSNDSQIEIVAHV